MSSFQLEEVAQRHLKMFVAFVLVLMLFKPFALTFYHQALTLVLFSITSFLQFLLVFGPMFLWICLLMVEYLLQSSYQNSELGLLAWLKLLCQRLS
jgi:hypothetical protein